MIEGIHVLSQEAITNPNWILFVFLALISVLVGAFVVGWCDSSFLASVLTFLLIFASYMFVHLVAEETGGFKYKVTIDESVSFVEVVEKYDLVGREGDIYILEEREIDND